MRMIREILRLKLECGLSDRQIAKTAGIAERIEDLNRRPFKKLPGCRRSAFEE